MTVWRRFCAALFVTAMAVVPAPAHDRLRTSELPQDGVAIAGITHGQMAVIAANLPAIRALAERQFPTDRVMRRLQGYVTLQSFACLWGLVPGSISDEASPFNECAHAYLAAALALFLHIREMPNGDTEAARALDSRMELQMLDQGASLVMCRYSDKAFSTSEVITPDWWDIFRHPPSLLTFSLLLLLPLIGAAAWSRVL